MFLPDIWNVIVHVWDLYKLYDLLLIALGVMAFHLLSKRLKEMREIADEFEEKFLKRTELLLSRVPAIGGSFASPIEIVSGNDVPDEEKHNPSEFEPYAEGLDDDARWTSLKEIWDKTKMDLNALVDKALRETTDGRKRRPYQRLDRRNFDNVILTLFDGSWIGDSAANVALDMNFLFNSYKNQRRPVSEADLQKYSQLRDNWTRLKAISFKDEAESNVQAISQIGETIAPKYKDLATFRHEFWKQYVQKYPDGSVPSYASSRWQSAGALVVAQYISKRGVGLFVRGPRGSAPSQAAKSVKPHIGELQRRLGVPFNNDKYMFSSFFPIDANDIYNWDQMSEWLKAETDKYTAALCDVVKK